MPKWATVLIALAVVLVINLLSAKAFGEFEFWASIIKVSAIVLFLVVGLVDVIGRIHLGAHKAGFSNLWKQQGRLLADERRLPLVRPVAGDVERHLRLRRDRDGRRRGRRDEGRARRCRRPSTPWSSGSASSTSARSCCWSACCRRSSTPVRHTAPSSPSSTRWALGWVGNVILGVLIVAALSSLNSGLYSTGRVLRSLGMSKQAPQFTPEDEQVGRALGRHRDDVHRLRVRRDPERRRPERVRDRARGLGGRRRSSPGPRSSPASCGCVSWSTAASSRRARSRCPGRRTRATSAWSSWRRDRGMAISGWQNSPNFSTRPISWSSCSASRSSPACWRSGGCSSARTSSRTPATSSRPSGRTTGRPTPTSGTLPTRASQGGGIWASLAGYPAANPPFSSLAEPELERVAGAAKVVDYDAGQEILDPRSRPWVTTATSSARARSSCGPVRAATTGQQTGKVSGKARSSASPAC